MHTFGETLIFSTFSNPAGVETGGGRADELLRVAAYVCMTPARLASSEVLASRRAGFARHVSCTHWPHAYVPSGYAPKGTPPLEPAALPAAQRRLIGFDRPEAVEEAPEEAARAATERPPPAASNDDGRGDCCVLN